METQLLSGDYQHCANMQNTEAICTQLPALLLPVALSDSHPGP